MSGPAYHAWTHLPDGTDPLEIATPSAALSFAVVEQVGIDLNADTGTAQLLTGSVDIDRSTNDDATFDVEDTPGTIKILTAGWYMTNGALDHTDEMPGLDRFFAVYGDASAAPGSDVLLAQGSNLDIGAGTFTRQTFHLFHMFEEGLLISLRVDLSDDTTVADARSALSVWKLG